MDVVQLHSGRLVEIRALRAEDGQALSASYEQLSEQTKYRRFLAPKPHLSIQDVEYLTNIDGTDHAALIAVPVGARMPREPESIIGVARYVRLPEDPDAAEFAIVIGDSFQRDGLGTAIMDRLGRIAIANGIKRLRGTMLADNVGAHRLTRRLAGPGANERRNGIVDELEIPLAAEPPLTPEPAQNL
jgi:protein lysine acetyltransferase